MLLKLCYFLNNFTSNYHNVNLFMVYIYFITIFQKYIIKLANKEDWVTKECCRPNLMKIYHNSKIRSFKWIIFVSSLIGLFVRSGLMPLMFKTQIFPLNYIPHPFTSSSTSNGDYFFDLNKTNPIHYNELYYWIQYLTYNFYHTYS